MKIVEYTDEQGRNFLSTIRNTDTDPALGLLQAPPDLDQLDWQVIKVTLHNLLVSKGLFSLEDVQQRQQDFNHAILATISKPVFKLYQEATQDGD